jgi:phage protein U
MRRIARTGEPLMPVDGLGWVWQRWVVTEVTEVKSVLVADGTPRRTGFRLTLRSCGADRA